MKEKMQQIINRRKNPLLFHQVGLVVGGTLGFALARTVIKQSQKGVG